MAIGCFTSFYKSPHLKYAIDETIRSYQKVDQSVKDLILRDGIRTDKPYAIHEFPPLASLGWQPISSECLQHSNLPGKFIKINNAYFDNKSIDLDGNKVAPALNDNLRRPYYAQKIRKAMQYMGISPQVPHEYIVSIDENRHIVVSEKLDIMTMDENLDHWQQLYKEANLQETVNKICELIKLTAFADANISNIIFTQSGEIAVIDTEPLGLFTDEDASDPVSKVDRYVRLGFKQLANSFDDKMGLRKVAYESSLWDQAKRNGSVYSAEEYDRVAMNPANVKFQPIRDAFTLAVDSELQNYENIPPEIREEEIRNGFVVNNKWNWSLIIASILILPPLILWIYSCWVTYCSKTDSKLKGSPEQMRFSQ